MSRRRGQRHPRRGRSRRIARGAIVKVILETALLNDEQKVAGAASWRKLPDADFVKTSTGFGTGRRHSARRRADAPKQWGRQMGVKASGGIRTLEDLKADGGRRRHPHWRQRQREALSRLAR